MAIRNSEFTPSNEPLRGCGRRAHTFVTFVLRNIGPQTASGHSFCTIRKKKYIYIYIQKYRYLFLFIYWPIWGSGQLQNKAGLSCTTGGRQRASWDQTNTDHHHMLHRVGADLVGPCWAKLSCEIWSAPILVRVIFAALPRQ